MGSSPEVIVVLDSNVLFSAMIRTSGCPYSIYSAWLDRRFTLATCAEQIGEIKTAYRAQKLSGIIPRHRLGRLLNEMMRSALSLTFARKHTTTDPTDAFLLDLAAAAQAHYLVTGDRRAGLLQRKRVDGTRILAPSEFCTLVLGLKS